METFSALLATCAGNLPVPGEFPAQRPVTRSFDVFFDLRLNKRPSKQWQGWWFETLSRHYDVTVMVLLSKVVSVVNSICVFMWTLNYGEFSVIYVTGGFPSERASNAENVSIWWHHHVQSHIITLSNLVVPVTLHKSLHDQYTYIYIYVCVCVRFNMLFYFLMSGALFQIWKRRS